MEETGDRQDKCHGIEDHVMWMKNSGRRYAPLFVVCFLVLFCLSTVERKQHETTIAIEISRDATRYVTRLSFATSYGGAAVVFGVSPSSECSLFRAPVFNSRVKNAWNDLFVDEINNLRITNLVTGARVVPLV